MMIAVRMMTIEDTDDDSDVLTSGFDVGVSERDAARVMHKVDAVCCGRHAAARA